MATKHNAGPTGHEEPTEAEIAFYRGILAKMRETDRRGDGAVRYEGEMIDYAMLARAEQVLRDAERYQRTAKARAGQ